MPGRLAGRVGVRPVAHERRVAAAKRAARVLLAVAGDAARNDGADPAFDRVQDRRRLGVVHGHLVRTGVDDRPTAAGRDPLQGIARESLVGFALEDKASERRVGTLLAVEDLLCLHGQLVPRQWRLGKAVLLQQIGAVIEHAEVGKVRHGD